MPENKAAHFPVKWLITIVDRGRGELAAGTAEPGS